MEVKLIEIGNNIFPVPEFNYNWSNLDKLNWHLSWSIAYLKRECGPIDVPTIKILESNIPRDNTYAVLINGTGTYNLYDEAWKYISYIFDGMRAVFTMPGHITQFEIPVTFSHDQDRLIGHGTIKRCDTTTDINIKVAEPIPEEMFDGLLEINFTHIPAKNCSTEG